MYVIALRHEAVLRYAGSYDMRPPSPSSAPIWRRSVARIVPSTIGMVYCRPVRSSVIVSVSAGTARPLSSSPAGWSQMLPARRATLDRLACTGHAPDADRGHPADPGPRPEGRSQHDLGVGAVDRALAGPAGLPRDRRAEGRHDGALHVPPLAPVDPRAVLEGGQLLRPALGEGRRLVPRPASASRRGEDRRRGQPELHLPPARA